MNDTPETPIVATKPWILHNKTVREILDFIKDLIIIIWLVVIIRSFLILPFQINGQSMYTSYYDREFIIVDRFSYLDIPVLKRGTPSRGDVIVFRPHVNKEKEYYIKRVIGVPGDSVKIVDGKVSVKTPGSADYQELDETYLSKENQGSTYVNGQSKENIYTVTEGKYFVMWDNRVASTDSRSCFSTCGTDGRSNFIQDADIIGKVFLDLWYFNIKSLSYIHPDYGISTVPKWFSSPSRYTYSLK